MTPGFADYCRRKEADALAASIAGYDTLSDDVQGVDLLSFGNSWTRRLFDGDFHRCAGSPAPELPAVSLLLSEPAAGGRVAATSADPSSHTSRHLIHEGLSRVDADAVLGGMGAATEMNQIYSVWHPELVKLRLDRGLPRHPAQVLVTNSGNVPFEDCLLFQEPSLRVIVLCPTSAARRVAARLTGRPWVRVVDAGEPLSMRAALVSLRQDGLAVVSAVGGVRVASTLLRERLVTDIYITTREPGAAASIAAFYDGPPLRRRRLLSKAARGGAGSFRFEHLVPPASYTPGLQLRGPQSHVLR